MAESGDGAHRAQQPCAAKHHSVSFACAAIGHPANHQPRVKEGFVMLYDTLQAHWQRVYLQLVSDALSIFSTSSKYARLVLPPIPLSRVRRLFASVEGVHSTPLPSSSASTTTSIAAPSSHATTTTAAAAAVASGKSGPAAVPATHRTVMALRTDDALVIMRTAERASLASWVEAIVSLDAAVHVAVAPVSAAASLRAFFSPQLYALMFRGEDAERPQLPASRVPDVPRTVADMRGGRGVRVASVSADVAHRRLPARRVAVMAGGHHGPLVPHATPTPKQTPAASPHSSPPKEPQPQRQHADPAAAQAVTSKTSIVAPPPDEPKSQQRAKPLEDRQGVNTPLAAATGAGSPRKAVSPSSPAQTAAPATANRDDDEQVRALRREVDELQRTNLNLELDNANISARVLELEEQATTLRAANAEWRRRFQSLEQQLSVQETDFTHRLAEEREAVLGNVQDEVKQQLEAMRERWRARESEYELQILELEGRLAAMTPAS